MRKFQFSLESVLKTKKIRENKLRKELMEIIRKKQAVEKEKSSLEKEMVKLENEYRSMIRQGSVTPEEINLFHNFFQNSQNKIKVIEKNIEKYKMMEKKKQESLVAASKDRKGMEKLKEKEKLRFNEKIKNMETKEMDENSMIKYNHESSLS
ncbi:MAG: flagellar export protein FliJ [bacterium]